MRDGLRSCCRLVNSSQWSYKLPKTLKFIPSFLERVVFARHDGGRARQGKRGGVRAIYYFASMKGVVYMLDIYAKNQKADLTPDDRKQLRRIVEQLRQLP